MSNLILANSWQQIVEESGRSDLLFCALEGMAETCNFLHKNEHTEYTVISGYSDFGVCYQKENHPNADIRKLVEMYIKPIEHNTHQYHRIPEIMTQSKQCHPAHEYSLKIDKYTLLTFHKDGLPENIKRWYMTNLNAYHPQLEWLPFGMNEQGHGKDLIKNYFNPPEKSHKLLYVNFAAHTLQRILAKEWFADKSFATVIPETKLDYETYASHLRDHKFVLCLPGNGLDCYRTYESMWAGCIVVAPNIPMYRNMQDLGFPIILFDSLSDINEDFLEFAGDLSIYKNFDWQKDILFLDYWKEKVLDCV